MNKNPDNKKLIEKVIPLTPLKRIGQPLDIAKRVSFLASSGANLITEVNLVIDGGIIYNIPGDYIHLLK